MSESRRSFLKKTSLISASLPLAGVSSGMKLANTENLPQPASSSYKISIDKNSALIQAGAFERRIDFANNRLSTSYLKINATDVLATPSTDFSVDLYQASPNKRPAGLKVAEDDRLIWADGSPANAKADNQPVEWKYLSTVNGQNFADNFRMVSSEVTEPRAGVSRLHLRWRSFPPNPLQGVFVDIYYEIYNGFPAIRKWIQISNNGNLWLKADKLTIDDLNLDGSFQSKTPLTPEEQGTQSSIIAFENSNSTSGIIAASEIPSATRRIGKNGAMGYAEEYFEWVLGPAESFTTEPVFYFAYRGDVIKTVSARSTPLDRCVEGPFKTFLQNCIGLPGKASSLPAPIWCSYSNFLVTLSDKDMREQADIAARIGFVTFQMDEGWAGTPAPGGSEPFIDRMPDFDNTCRYITSKGLKLGLWISCFRGDNAKDLAALPDARSLPYSINTKRGAGMGFASKWRDYFANDLIYMADRYGMSYVKQDLTNISKGDIAEGHESRTRKESILRGLRGLLKLNKKVSEQAPHIWTQITHELYWRTPGPPADIAALKNACAFHTTPNTYLGAGYGSKRVSQDWNLDPLKLRADLIKSCDQARQRFYDHRGLPLYSVEFYAAHAVNVKGSLTPAVQDRQICSWLLGGPTVYAGDLSSLMDEHVAHYRKRFDLLKTLQARYNIYNYFQFSGVPQPTDTDWHWWGKLNSGGCGAVVIIRGSGGKDVREINIPWVDAERKYLVTAHFTNKKPGYFTGRQLIAGKLALTLPPLGQEILELSPTG